MALVVGFLDRLLESLLKTGLRLIEHVLKPLGRSVLVPLRLMTAAIHKKLFGSKTAVFMFLNKDLNDIMIKASISRTLTSW